MEPQWDIKEPKEKKTKKKKYEIEYVNGTNSLVNLAFHQLWIKASKQKPKNSISNAF